MKAPTYVLVTPVRNEEKLISITIESVIGQSILPKEWIIVSDGSTDRTDEIVRGYAEKNKFIRLLRLDRGDAPSFAKVVFATESGYKYLQTTDYNYIGLLDSDVRFKPDYYAGLMQKFAENSRLGLAGGWVRDVINGVLQGDNKNFQEVAGATQFFDRRCFESLGGLLPIPEGGWDAITCVRARMNGYDTRTFPDQIMEHLKPRNAVFGNPIRRKWQMGVRDHALASHPLFEAVKCAAHMMKSPFIIGGVVRFAAYVTCILQRRKTLLPDDIANFMRREQLARVLPFKRATSHRSLLQPSASNPKV